jgi:hypothetical protein
LSSRFQPGGWPVMCWLMAVTLSSFAFAQEMEIDLTTDEPPRKPPVEEAIDLSDAAAVNGVLVLPPVVRVVTKKATFVGVDNGKFVERFDAAAHQRLHTAFQKELEGKTIDQSSAWSVTLREATPANLKNPDILKRLAAATKVDWLVAFELSKTSVPSAQLFDASGAAIGAVVLAEGQTVFSDAAAQTLAKQLTARITQTAAARAKALAEKERANEVKPPPAPAIVEQDTSDAELQRLAATRTRQTMSKQPERLMRAQVLVGPGAALRSLEVGGRDAPQLAELQSNGVFGFGVFVAVAPLQWFEQTVDKRFSDVQLHVNYRRSVVGAKGIQGSVDGRQCQVVEDDLQIRAHGRYRFTDGAYATSVGLAAGWSQEQTAFSCDFPLVSALYRGVDVQASVRQPLYKNWLSLEAAVGPRFLGGVAGTQPGLSFAGEAWVEAQPIRYLTARAGARLSRLTALNEGVTVADTRVFLGVEVGAFF